VKWEAGWAVLGSVWREQRVGSTALVAGWGVLGSALTTARLIRVTKDLEREAGG
jgi:hypothetical protein